MAATKDMMKAEALRRMRSLGMFPQTVKEFQKAGKVSYSHCGIIYWCEGDYKARIEKFEEETGYVVYHAIESYTDFGKLLTLLYVSSCDDEWEMDRKYIEDGEAFAYVINFDEECFSEYGYVGIQQRFGGLIRVA